MATTTISLDDKDADRIKALTKTFGGSVAGFCGAWGSLVSQLPPREIIALRQTVEAMIEMHRRPDGVTPKIGAPAFQMPLTGPSSAPGAVLAAG
jgi:hypothetical protein